MEISRIDKVVSSVRESLFSLVPDLGKIYSIQDIGGGCCLEEVSKSRLIDFRDRDSNRFVAQIRK